MKTRRDIFGGLTLAAAALVCLTGCKKDDEGEKVVLGADFEQTAGTQKTYVGNSDKTIYWNTEDQVKVNGKEYPVNEGAVEVKLNEDGYAAVYPATEGNTLTYSGGTSGRYCTGGTVVIPATQNYTKKDGHQVLGGPMAARLDNKTGRLMFRNLYAVIKVTVQAKSDAPFTLNSITVESTNGVNLAGTQPFTFNAATNTEAPTLGNLTEGSGNTCVTLNFENPVTISAGGKDSFYLYTVPFSGANLMITINGNLVDDTGPKGPRVGIAIDRSRLGSTMVDAVKLHEFVDLGLTSGILWATCNVGASKREDFGDYYAWGETEPYYSSLKADYTPAGWKSGKDRGYCRETYSGDGQPTGSDENNAKIIEWDPVPFAYDDKTNTYQLKSTNDAATTNWSNKWRTPTHAELQELVNNCTWEWKENYNDNGHKGYLVTSKINGYTDKAIFLPAAGRYSGTALQNADIRLYYSSSTLTGASGSRHICYLRYCPTDKDEEKGALQFGWRDQGFSVRPVMSKN